VQGELALSSTSVVYPGTPPGFSPGPSPETGYVLHLGSDDPREDTATAVAACRAAGVRLRVAGGWRGEGAEALGRVSDEELVDLYRGASCFLDPTLYEGFGYGALQAMACGVPVVASAVTSVPEVVGDAGLLCRPRSVDEFAEAVGRVVGDPALAAELGEKGLRRSAAFTWDATGAGLAEGLARAVAA
jgi:glycosyltransferase involved in cell wall biosynthesis